MDFGRFRFFVGEVVTNLTRNAAMQITAIGTVMVTIVLLGSFLFIRELGQHLSTQVLSQIQISVYLNDASTDASAAIVQQQIAHQPHVRSIVYIPKAEGFKEMSRRMAGQIDTSLLTSNPLPNAFHVTVDAPAYVRFVAGRISRLNGVDRVNYAQNLVAKLLHLSDVFERIELILVVALGFVATIIIANTIRLTVFARRREIAIMQLVGATNAYIRAPFICEGMIDGLLGAVLAVGVLYAGDREILPRLGAALPFIPLNHLGINERLIALELLGVGAAVGSIASWFSVGRYLRTN